MAYARAKVHIDIKMYNMKNIRYLLILLLLIQTSCGRDEVENIDPQPEIPADTVVLDNLIICNEGNWQSDNGQLSYFDASTATVTNKWFRQVNGMKLGDTPNDIIQVNDTLIAIAINWSNIIQYIYPDGVACGATENVPNNRKMCTDGKYLYVTSYAHKCGDRTFEKGYVAKIDIGTLQVVAACEVGWEPEGVKYYGGKLYVANSGGYSFSEMTHDYESTISVVDARDMVIEKTIDTGCINLYGEISQAGKYLCINAAGDYYEEAAHTIIVDCETDRVSVLEFPSTYNTTDGKRFYTIGSEFSYYTGEYKYHIHTIDPETIEVRDEIYSAEVTEKIKELTSPYELYISPYTGSIYFTDAKSFATAGYLYGYSKNGEELFDGQKVYINPGHILAVKE